MFGGHHANSSSINTLIVCPRPAVSENASVDILDDESNDIEDWFHLLTPVFKKYGKAAKHSFALDTKSIPAAPDLDNIRMFLSVWNNAIHKA